MKIISLLTLAAIAAGSVSQSANAESLRRCVSNIESGRLPGGFTAEEITKRIQYYQERDGVPPGFYFSTPTRFGGGKNVSFRKCSSR